MTDPTPPPDTEPAPSDAPAPRPHKKLERTLAVATTLVRHRQLLVEALELLRKSQVVTPTEEAELVATYEGGTELVRRRIDELVERLQQSTLGSVVVALHDQPDVLRIHSKALTQDVREEVNRFLAENRPTLEAVERVASDLADMGRELAQSLKGVGREAADHLLHRGRTALLEADTSRFEDAALDWTLRTATAVERRLRTFLITLGALLIVTGFLVAAREVPYASTVAFALLVVLLFYLGILLLLWGRALNRALASSQSELNRLAAMTALQRRTYLIERFRVGRDERPAATPMPPDPIVPEPTTNDPPTRDVEPASGPRFSERLRRAP